MCWRNARPRSATSGCGCAGVLLLSLLAGAAGAQEQRPAPVTVVKLATAPARTTLPLAGNVTSRRLSRLSPKVAGLVAALYVDEGDEVAPGRVLLELDKAIAELDQSAAQARVKEARARLSESVRRRDEAAELVRKKHLAATSYAATLAAVEIDAAALERLEAELRRQEEILRRHQVTAPFGGVITRRMVETGEWVKIDTALFDLVEMDALWVDVPAPQFYFNDVRPGTPVQIAFDAYPGARFPAVVAMKIPMSNEAARTFPVRIDLDNRQRLVTPGMSARVVFQLDDKEAEQVLLAPQDAIVRSPDGGESIWVLRQEQDALKARPVNVRTGRAYRENIEISGGAVQAGDRAVVRGNELLRPGQPVRIQEELQLNPGNIAW